MTLFFYQIFIKPTDNKDRHKTWTSSILANFRLLVCGLPALEGPIDFRKCCSDDSNFIFDGIFFRLAGNEDSHILDEFNFEADQTIHIEVTWFNYWFSFTLAYSRISHEYSSLFIIVINLIFMYSL